MSRELDLIAYITTPTTDLVMDFITYINAYVDEEFDRWMETEDEGDNLPPIEQWLDEGVDAWISTRGRE